jgi:hypothetical protein
LLKRSITYENPFTNQEVTEEHWFHLSKAMLIQLQMETLNEPEILSAEGERLDGFRAMLQRIATSRDGVAILQVVKDMIGRSYGKRDGDKFLRNSEILAEFEATEAYSQLIFDLCTDAEALADFMNGIMPRNIEQEAIKIAARTAALQEKIDGITPTSAVTTEPEQPVDAISTEPQGTLAERIAAATAENPITLTRAELVEIDSDELKSGIATGRLKL